MEHAVWRHHYSPSLPVTGGPSHQPTTAWDFNGMSITCPEQPTIQSLVLLIQSMVWLNRSDGDILDFQMLSGAGWGWAEWSSGCVVIFPECCGSYYWLQSNNGRAVSHLTLLPLPWAALWLGRGPTREPIVCILCFALLL